MTGGMKAEKKLWKMKNVCDISLRRNHEHFEDIFIASQLVLHLICGIKQTKRRIEFHK
jgi:hypothetical protein